MNRSDFLAKTIATGIILSSRPIELIKIMNHKKAMAIIVICAGLAGLTAGIRLKKEKNFQITINDSQNHNIENLKYYWESDPYSLDTYAFYGKNQRLTIIPVLEQNHSHCFFAGGHSNDWQGFMEEAINSGEESTEKLITGI